MVVNPSDSTIHILQEPNPKPNEQHNKFNENKNVFLVHGCSILILAFKLERSYHREDVY